MPGFNRWQLIAMKYGTLPVVSRVGGLADTVKGYPASDATVFFIDPLSEDGIRDKLVTGVQTCALPISRHG